MAQILIAAAIMLLSWPAFGVECSGQQTTIMVDRTTAYDQIDIDVIMPAVRDMASNVAPGQRVTVVSVADKAEHSQILFDGCVPGGSSVWSGLSFGSFVSWAFAKPDDPADELAAFKADFQEIIRSEIAVDPNHTDLPATALIGTLSVHAADADQIWLLSDLLESSTVPAHELIATGFPDGLTPRLKRGAVVHAAGYGRFHDRKRRPLTEAQKNVLLDAWRGVVERAGGRFEK